jgi:ribosomal protein S8
MSNLRLFTTSILIIVILAGTVHVFANIKNKESMKKETIQLPKVDQTVQQKNQIEAFVGNWEVVYNSEEFTGKIHYELKLEENQIKGYMKKVFDRDGNFENTNALTLIIKTFNVKKNKGKGTYKFEYEGKNYDTSCNIILKSENQFELGYSYYDYRDTETWNKLTK